MYSEVTRRVVDSVAAAGFLLRVSVSVCVRGSPRVHTIRRPIASDSDTFGSARDRKLYVSLLNALQHVLCTVLVRGE